MRARSAVPYLHLENGPTKAGPYDMGG